MTNFLEVTSKPNELLSMTEHTLEEFDALLSFFEDELLESKLSKPKKEKKGLTSQGFTKTHYFQVLQISFTLF